MNLVELVIIILQIRGSVSKKKHREKEAIRLQSDESFENLLYFKDCKHNKNTTPVMLRATEAPKPLCPCPRMCCSMCCDCDAPSPFANRPSAPIQSELEPLMVPRGLRRPPSQNMMSPMLMAHQPHLQNNKLHMKKLEPKELNAMMEPPMLGSRRDFGFTRENIKSLIAHDQDIKKILKDLVRVTMNKVDLVEELNARKKMDEKTPPPVVVEDEDDYVD